MPLWLSPAPLVLASQSKVRRAVLEAAGIPVEARPAHLDERAIERPGRLGQARRRGADARAREGAHGRRHVGSAARRRPATRPWRSGERRFDKPADRAAARAQLLALRGQTHELHSGVAVVRGGALAFGHVAVARLTMRSFSEAFLDAYLDAAGAAVTASVGAYQLERTGIHLFEKVEGDHFTILGLPLLPLLDYLRDEGALAG